MRAKTSIVVIIFFSLAVVGSAPALADPPSECVVPQSVVTPCVGVLLPSSAAAEGLRCLQVDFPRLKLDLLKERELFELRLSTVNLILDQEKIRATRIEGLLDTSLKRVVTATPWYEHPVFWAVTGVIIGAAATVGIAHAVSPAVR